MFITCLLCIRCCRGTRKTIVSKPLGCLWGGQIGSNVMASCTTSQAALRTAKESDEEETGLGAGATRN